MARLTITEAAEMLGVSHQRISQLVQRGVLPRPLTQAALRRRARAMRQWRARLSPEARRRLRAYSSRG